VARLSVTGPSVYSGFVATSADTADEIACPDCGETEDLAGERDEQLIRITCERCAAVWHRDPQRRCPRCDSGDLYAAPVAVIEKSRGTQLSIVSTRSEYLCWSCDRDLIDAQRQSGTALMPDQLPTL
jgi:ribosomal protein S27AE